MYTVLEHKEVAKAFKRVPAEIKRSYLAWKRIVELEGPQGLRLIKGFHDETLKGEWGGFRSSRLNRQWRVIYKIDKDQLIVYVVEINPHSY
ncbi:MAG: type II toxin-antitoxin system mRNA interferase toxin, RelE/StbE family [Deltaproteobacteria bacterium]|nr:type II toxin-antitoxin system mRNA interferase toxin, RelE/StbE family [Deltaproteobacteria bacterium]